MTRKKQFGVAIELESDRSGNAWKVDGRNHEYECLSCGGTRTVEDL